MGVATNAQTPAEPGGGRSFTASLPSDSFSGGDNDEIA